MRMSVVLLNVRYCKLGALHIPTQQEGEEMRSPGGQRPHSGVGCVEGSTGTLMFPAVVCGMIGCERIESRD